MKKETLFRGVATALVTPFSDGKIDYAALEGLIERQIDAGIDALVIAGTTGEAATLDDDERYQLYRFASKTINKRICLILGTGTNDTKSSIRHSLFAKEAGADALLIVTPYYNKGTKSGVVRHFSELADKVDMPIIIYNVPTRTGVDLSIAQIDELAEHDRIVGIKESSDSVDKLAHISRLAGKLDVYAGNDSCLLANLAHGGSGVISVASNLYPCEIISIYKQYLDGKFQEAREAFSRLIAFFDAIFCETNPAPIKYAMSIFAYLKNELRLPLAPISRESEEKILSVTKALSEQ